MATADIWVYRADDVDAKDLSGFGVEAADGSIGKIDEASNEVGAGYLVVDTGVDLGKKVLLPAGIVRDVDPDSETVFVNRTKDQIKNAPEFDPDRYRDETYRSGIGSYYGRAAPATATTIGSR